MVGDIKQSIYRFRQADPQIFNGKFQLFLENPDVGKLILLKENFRSQSEVLDATNGVFSHLMDQEIGDILYDKTSCWWRVARGKRPPSWKWDRGSDLQ